MNRDWNLIFDGQPHVLVPHQPVEALRKQVLTRAREKGRRVVTRVVHDNDGQVCLQVQATGARNAA